MTALPFLNPGPYRPPAWLPGGHLQTIYPFLLPRAPRPAYRRERWTTPDGDFLLLDWVGDACHAPLVVVFHGLEGDAQGYYARHLMHRVARAGWRGVVVHFRGCGGEPNRLPRAYHAGDSAEIDWVLRRLRAQAESVFVTGVSLGGNALLKWLGEQGEAARDVVAAATAVSAPVDLLAAGQALDRGFNLVYTRHFLRSLKPKALAMLREHPTLFSAQALRRADTLFAFDDLVTAPLHGFQGARDYWTRASSKPGLKHVTVPTLLLNARNDPFLPARALPRAQDVSPAVRLEFPAEGGHVGFVTGRFPGRLDWLPRRLLHFFREAARL